MTSRKLDDLIRQMSGLEERELIFVLGRVLPRFAPYDGDAGVARSGFFLGTFRVVDELELDIVAYPDPQQHADDPGPDWGLCQSTESEVDGLDYVSNVKRCLSPFDGRPLNLT